MGGYNSGRHGGGPTVDSTRTIAIRDVIRKRSKADRQGWRGSMTWTHRHTNETTMTLSFTTYISADEGWVDLDHTTHPWGKEPERISYRVWLHSTPQPFGGLRWFFMCPLNGKLATKLHLPLGGTVFGSREGYRLSYASQRNTVHDRAINQAWKARLALGGRPGLDPLGSDLDKPKYRHWRTFDRDMAALRAREAVTNIHLLRTLAKWGNRWAIDTLVKMTSRAA